MKTAAHRPTTLKTRFLVGALAPVFLFMTEFSPRHAEAQFLELEPLPPAPELDEVSIVIEMADAARRDMDLLDARRSDDMIISTITKAIRTYRKITYSLLALARTEADAHHLAITGIRMHDLREEIDKALTFLGKTPPEHASGTPLPPSEIAACLTLLDRFSARGTRLFDRIDVTRQDDLDAAIALTMEPLLEFLLIIEERSLVDPWPANREQATLSSDELKERIRSTGQLRRRETAVRILEQIEAAGSFADLRTGSEEDLAALARALMLEDALAEALWLNEEIRSMLLLRLDDTLHQWLEPDSRETARLRLAHIGLLASLVTETNGLDALDSRGRSQRRGIDEVLATDIGLIPDRELAGRHRRIARVIRAVRIAAETRRMERIQPERYLLPIRRALDKDYKRAEQEVFQRIAELVSTRDALIDPDLAGLVSRQRELADDLALLRASRGWTELVSERSPQDLKRFMGVIERHARNLTQPARRTESSRILDQMRTHFSDASSPPFVDRLDGSDLDAMRLVGGRDRELLATLKRTQIELIRDWLDGKPDEDGSRTFELLIRLLEQADSFSSLSAFGGTDQLGRWGGWHLPTGGGIVDATALAARLKVASTALIRGDTDSAARQLDKLDREMPSARLAMEIAARLDGAMQGIEDSPASALATIAVMPNTDDMLIVFRDDLLNLARHSWELKAARNRGDKALAEELQAYCSALADLIVDDLGGRPLPENEGGP